MDEKKVGKVLDEGSWDKHKARLKLKFSSLTDEDLHFESGKMDKMFEKIKIRLGKSRDEMHRIIAYLSLL